MTDKLEKTSENKPERNEKGQLLPGNTANPNGRPKGSLSITALVKEELEKVPDGQKVSYAEALIKKMLHKAIIEGDTQTQKMIWNYIDGLPKGALDLTSGGEALQEFLWKGNQS